MLLLRYLIAALMVTSPVLAEGTSDVKPVLNEKTGFWEADVPSEYQSGPARVRILLPKSMPDGAKLPVLYILPVVGGWQKRPFGDGLEEARKADLANKYGLICAEISFNGMPWYGDHATDPLMRHESHMLKVVVPWMDATYPTQAEADGRWLIGFSKSGWGAVTLLMRHPETFGYAAAWDVPFMLNGDNTKDWGPMGLKKNFGTKEQMQKNLPTQLAEVNVEWLGNKPRLVIGAGKTWKSPSTQYHKHLEKLGIPHTWRDDLVFKHRWDTGWFAPMANDLAGIAGRVER